MLGILWLICILLPWLFNEPNEQPELWEGGFLEGDFLGGSIFMILASEKHKLHPQSINRTLL